MKNGGLTKQCFPRSQCNGRTTEMTRNSTMQKKNNLLMEEAKKVKRKGDRNQVKTRVNGWAFTR